MHRRSQKTKFEVIWSSEVRKRALESWRPGQNQTMFKTLKEISDFTGKILRIRITIYHRWWTLATLFDSYWCDKAILTTRTSPKWSVECLGTSRVSGSQSISGQNTKELLYLAMKWWFWDRKWTRSRTSDDQITSNFVFWLRLCMY